MNKKILILYAAIGEGHKSIAENIGFYLEQAGFKVEYYDVQKVQSGRLVDWGTKLYQLMIGQFPFVWSWLYNTKWFISLTLPYRNKVAAKNYQGTLEIINQLKPDAVISTHTTASGIISYLKSQNLYQGKFGIAFSDFHLHRFWLYEGCDFYLANIQEQKQQMVELGIEKEKIFICGIILKPKIAVNIEEIKNKLGINSRDKVALISSGSQGTGVDEVLITKLSQKEKVKVIVVCGKNKKLFESLSEKFAGTSAIILGYYSPMEQLYAVADIYITKPGGLSVSEALRFGLPILVSHMLPGQEEWNYSYLLEKSLIMAEGLNPEAEALEELETGVFKKVLLENKAILSILNGQDIAVEAVIQALK